MNKQEQPHLLKRQNSIIHVTHTHSAFDDRIFYKELCSLAKKYECYELCGTDDGKTVATMGGEKRDSGIYKNVNILAFKSEYCTFLGGIKRLLLPIIYNHLYTRATSRRILRILKKKNIQPDIIHFHEVELAPVIEHLKKSFSCKVIFDSHEFFFSYPFNNGLNYKTCLLASRMLILWKKAIRTSDFTIACTRTMDNLVSIIRQDDNHGIIYNSAFFTLRTNRRSIAEKEKITLVHEGSMPFNRGLRLMVEIFRDDYIRRHFQLRIVGTLKGAEKEFFERKSREYNITSGNISITGWVDYLKVQDELQGDIGILFFEKTFNAFYSMPNKLFNYHNAGMPVLATHCAELSDTIQDLKTGIVVERNVESVKEGLKELVANYKEYQANVLLHQQDFNWAKDETRLFEIYKTILSDND